MSLLEFDQVTFKSIDSEIVKNISIEINKGDFISIVGPSGSGKSTFLKLCSHLISPSSGSITYNGKSIYDLNPMELRKKVSYCFQTPYLFGDTVKENIEFAYSIRNRKIDKKRVKELFELFNLNEDYLNKEVKNLSGGEKQRISLIRTLLFKPEVLLLDEVTSALDSDNTMTVERAVKELNKEGITILWVTHNLEQSRRHANKLMTLEGGKVKAVEVIQHE